MNGKQNDATTCTNFPDPLHHDVSNSTLVSQFPCTLSLFSYLLFSSPVKRKHQEVVPHEVSVNFANFVTQTICFLNICSESIKHAHQSTKCSSVRA